MTSLQTKNKHFSLVCQLPHVELIKCFYSDLGHLLILTKGNLNQLVDIGTMNSLGMENRNLKLGFANFTIKEAKWELPRSQDVPRDGHDPLLTENRKISEYNFDKI